MTASKEVVLKQQQFIFSLNVSFFLMVTFIFLSHNFKNVYLLRRNNIFIAKSDVSTFWKNQTAAKPVSDKHLLMTVEAEI